VNSVVKCRYSLLFCFLSERHEEMNAHDDRGRNGLVGERSPFLQHGATQPVDWSPWSEAAFERARAEDRPILLDIGAVWCHWCHVMDHESYDDSETAALINALYVPVKVDRDERPDVDARYQRAVQMLTGQGGWPLTAFLTPDGEVFYAGTYFPPVDAHGRPSFRRVLGEVARVWRDERPRALDAARDIGERLVSYAQVEAAAGEPSAELLDRTIEELADSFDFRHGGFGRAPKFPNAGALDLLLDHWLDTGTGWTIRVITETLDAMARGGIHDQLGGGFHRYATDARWLIPHFEKMAYDNGPLLATYARAFAVLDSSLYDEVVDGIIGHYRDIAPALVDEGGFPASQDADFGFDNDGDYWTWTEEELRAALDDPSLLRSARLRYGLDDPAAGMHLDPSRRVLFRALEADAIAAGDSAGVDGVRTRLDDVRRRLKATRDLRPRPFVDETLYTGWVALVASGHLAAARHLNRSDAALAAVAALDRIHREAYDAHLGYAHRVGDRATGELLEDQAHVAAALVDAFEVTQEAALLERARAVMDLLLTRFRDPSTGGLLDRPRNVAAVAAPLDRPHLPIADSPVPSGNGVAALTLLRLSALTSETSYRDEAASILRAFAGSAGRLGASAATWMKALSWTVRPVTTVVVVGEREAGPARELLDTALRAYRPRTVVRWFAEAGADADSLPPALRAIVTSEAPRAYVCAGRTCAAPVSSAKPLRELLRSFHG
jgi:hypothetical protein